jgi:hypothetical protein
MHERQRDEAREAAGDPPSGHARDGAGRDDWQDRILELREQIALMQEEPLVVD